MADDFEAEQDMEILTRAEEILNNPGRIAAARNAATAKKEKMDAFLAKTREPTKALDGSVRGSKMGP